MWGDLGGSPSNMTGILRRRGNPDINQCRRKMMWGHREKMDVCLPGKEEEINSANTSVSDFQPREVWDRCLRGWSYQVWVWGICYGGWSWLIPYLSVLSSSLDLCNSRFLSVSWDHCAFLLSAFLFLCVCLFLCPCHPQSDCHIPFLPTLTLSLGWSRTALVGCLEQWVSYRNHRKNQIPLCSFSPSFSSL